MKTKQCSRCGVIKLLTEFTNSNNSEDGKFCYCRECKKQYDSARYQRPEIKAQAAKLGNINYHRWRVAAFTRLAKKPHCELCGCAEFRFLTIDHKFGGGKQHRILIGQAGTYRAIIRDSNPRQWARILCFQCNFVLPLLNYDECALKAAIKREHTRIKRG